MGWHYYCPKLMLLLFLQLGMSIQGKYYETQHRLSHTDVMVGTAGFMISPLHPFIGASPDGYVSCSCCGSVVIEIKCPFSVKDCSVNEAANSVAHFCLKKDVQGKIRLKRDHAYYYQVQMQLFVTDNIVISFCGLKGKVLHLLLKCHT